MKFLKIEKGFFRSAGNVYKWGKEYHVFGVGIAKSYLSEDNLELEVEGKRYIIDCKEALEFIRKYRTYKVVGVGKRIGVVSKSLLHDLEENNTSKLFSI